MTMIETGIQEVDPKHQLDIPKLEAFVREHLDEFSGSLRVRQFVGGQSNPTYHLSDGQGEWVLRRKPPGKLVSSAHAIDREYTILSALSQTDFPVPRVRVYCKEESVIGTEFYLMDRVHGRIIPDQTLPGWNAEDRRSLYASQIEILAQLHQIDFESIGLGGYGKKGNYFARQIHVWSKQYITADVPRSAAMERLMEWFPENVPADDTTTIVHGDFGLNNLMIHPTEGRLVAVLDWELSTLGHPLADLTYHLSQRLSPKGVFGGISETELAEMGIPTREEYVGRYCELVGRDGIDDLDFYLAFHLFRTAGIMFGIAGRAKVGTAAGSQAAELGKLALPLADLSLEYARTLGA